jgi:hypothetical protein
MIDFTNLHDVCNPEVSSNAVAAFRVHVLRSRIRQPIGTLSSMANPSTNIVRLIARHTRLSSAPRPRSTPSGGAHLRHRPSRMRSTARPAQVSSPYSISQVQGHRSCFTAF